MITAEIVHGRDGLDIQYSIRESVFIKEQGIPKELEQDKYDSISDHVIITENNEFVGTGRIILKDNKYLIGRIAVLKEHRGKGYGDLIVRKLVSHAFEKGVQRVHVHSQLPVIEFYETIGFTSFADEFMENGILHQAMYVTPDTYKKQCQK